MKTHSQGSVVGIVLSRSGWLGCLIGKKDGLQISGPLIFIWSLKKFFVTRILCFSIGFRYFSRFREDFLANSRIRFSRRFIFTNFPHSQKAIVFYSVAYETGKATMKNWFLIVFLSGNCSGMIQSLKGSALFDGFLCYFN